MEELKTTSLPDIIYTKVDEAPELASRSLLPIIGKFTKAAGLTIGTKDISLSGRILANFPKYLNNDQKVSDDLAELGKIVKKPEANIIKLPNISASIPQLNAAISELQDNGFNVPSYPENPQNKDELVIKDVYSKILGSAVNPVLREGNSDRRAPNAVKEFAKKHPHTMGDWDSQSLTHVATMNDGDFFSNEKSFTVDSACAGAVEIKFISRSGEVELLKEGLSLGEGDVVDSTKMDVISLREFIRFHLEDAKLKDVLFSVHLKSTMMKVSDPIIFGHFVSVFFEEIFEKYSDIFADLSVIPENGLGELFEKLSSLPADLKDTITADILAVAKKQPDLYMVDSDKGISNLHVPSDVIIDASMPALIRGGGKSWGPDGLAKDTKCIIPDSTYASLYDETIKFCKEHGAFDPRKMGSVSNVGLMAQKAEEYGSHPQTFKAPEVGTITIVASNGQILTEHSVNSGDIWRMCITRDSAITDWVKLAVNRAHITAASTIFWLNEQRAHDQQLIRKVNYYLENNKTDQLKIKILSPREATRYSLGCIAKGEDTVSVTGNVLRDYITDLFPILEVGTSAKMLSIVPLMNGGSMFETGAGGSAPKHVQQLIEEGHLRWDSLGEFCALAASLEFIGEKTDNKKAVILAKTLDEAIGKLLNNKKSPSRRVGEIDNRGSHYYLALYWSKTLAAQSDDVELKTYFSQVAEQLDSKETEITSELLSVQGRMAELGGYHFASAMKMDAVMRPSPTLNAIIGG